MVVRFERQRDHWTFIGAAAILLRRRSAAKFLFVGHGAPENNQALLNRLKATGLKDFVILLEWRDDITRVLPSADSWDARHIRAQGETGSK
jgi:glycosyltransferase involved in cell wall biosynthesis